uniref:BPI1 domain-containing protein n=1 Tax=Steinernema glaseri TaxID=37863 RepID=A0A1I8ACJ3_9BILA
MTAHLCLLLLLTTLVNSAQGTAPGAEIQVNQRGLDAFAQVGVSLLNKRIPGMSIPDASSFMSEDIHFDWSLWDIKIDKFHVDETKTGVSGQPSDKIEDLSFDITANYRIKVREGWVHASKSGTIEAWTSGAKTEVTVSITLDNGRPHLNPVYCDANLGDFEIKFHGGLISKIIDIFRKAIAKHLKSKLNGVICDEVTKIVSQEGNGLIATVPFEYNFGGDASGFHVDYSLTSSPYATNQYIGIPVLGKFWYDGHRGDSAIPKPTGAVKPLARNEMVCIALDGQGLFGSATYAFRQSPKSHFNIDSNVLRHFPAKISQYFTCDCTGKECITTLIPEIKAFCKPGASLVVDAEATAFPGFHFNASGAYLSVQGKGEFKMVLPDGLSTPLFELDATIGILIQSNLRIENWVIKGDVKLYSAELSARSPVVPISTNHIQALWKEALSAVVSGIADTVLSHGIPLPNLPKATPVDPKFAFSSNELLFCCDLKPSF